MVEEVYRRRRAAHKAIVSRETRWPLRFHVKLGGRYISRKPTRRLDVQ
jgi:hypothetical protein